MSTLEVIPLPAEVWWADFGPGVAGEPIGARPAIVVAPAADLAPNSPTVTVIPMTRTHRQYPFRVEVLPDGENGLDKVSFAQIDLVRSISKTRLLYFAGYLESETWNRIQAILGEYFDV